MAGHRLGLMRRSALVMGALALVGGACTGGTNGSTTATSPAQSADGDGVESTTATTVSAPAETAADEQSSELSVVDADSAERCDRFGYPCNWADADDITFQRSLELLDATVAIFSQERDLEELVLEATEMLLAEPDVAEVHPQLDTLSSVVFRVEGAQEVLALTDVAELAGEAAPGLEQGAAAVA